jgi:hypothetical protein
MRLVASFSLLLAALLLPAGVEASGPANEAHLAKQVGAGSRQSWTFHPKNATCSSYIGGKCPTFRLGRVTCEPRRGFSLCSLTYHETSDPYDKGIVWTTRIEVTTANGAWHRTKTLPPACADQGVYEGCLVVLYT